MAKLSLLALFLSFLCLSYGCCGQEQQQRGQCQIQNLNPEEPRYQIQAECGVTEIWDSNNDQFQCAGVAMLRHVIQPGGFLMPSYTSSHLISYVQQGRGFFGLMVPGCPETFQSSQVQMDRRRRFYDQHQKIQHCREGDILAFPAGAAHWVYNNGDQPLVLVVLQDTSSNGNQLDRIPRRFFIAGNPQGQQQQGKQGQQGEQEPQGGGQLTNSGNVFKGFSVEILAAVFNVDIETARKLQGEDDQRGHIIRVEGLQVLSPPITEREQQGGQVQEYGGGQNGLEETVCTARVRENIDNPSGADVYNPQGGRFTTANSLTFPILSFLQLSAERGVLYRNAIMSPHWYVNAHAVVYVTRGEARVQIVDNRGQTVFNDQLRRGQVVVVPMGYAVVKRAGNRGFEWVAFNTNDNAMLNTLVGRTSTIAGLPASVLANGYQISQEKALRLKYSRMETIILSPSSNSVRIASE